MHELTAKEWRVVQRLRQIKAEDAGRGHGTLRVDVIHGREHQVRREFSELLPHTP